MDRYDEKCVEYLVEKDSEISVLEFNLIEHMLNEMDLLWLFLEPVDLFFRASVCEKGMEFKKC